MKKSPYVLALILIIVLVGCNLPNGKATPAAPEAVFTQAAETVAAELTRVALLASPTPRIPSNTPVPTNTSTPFSTNTPIFTPTNTPNPCLLVGFNNATIDQTVPDNQIMLPGQVFKKTWRLINAGTCTWNSSYQLVFDRGDGMGVPTGYAQTLTAGSISQGQTVDVSVTLTAPTTPGTYTGYWRFRDPNGIYFGIGGASSWLVKIKVVSATTITLPPVVSESGSIRSDGSIFTGELTAGDTVENFAVQAFISYDISSIPDNATILEVKNKFTSYTSSGDPFGHLGVLNGYKDDFNKPLIAANFIEGLPGGNIIDWGALTVLDNTEVQPTLVAAIQSKVGTSRFKLRLQFAGTNNDGIADFVRFTTPSLIVEYSTP